MSLKKRQKKRQKKKMELLEKMRMKVILLKTKSIQQRMKRLRRLWLLQRRSSIECLLQKQKDLEQLVEKQLELERGR